MSSFLEDAIVRTRRLEGKVAIVTGGASGIGAASVRLFARNGAKIIIADVQDKLGQSLCKEIGLDENECVDFVHCDVTREEDIKTAVDYAITKHGKLDIMFNNAAIGGILKPSILDTEKEDFETVYDINLFGAFLGAKHAARVMVPAKKGCILFNASVATAMSPGALHPYVSCKHGMVGLAKNLCVELGKFGIRVNCVSPHGVATPLSTQMSTLNELDFEKKVSVEMNLKGVTLKGEDIAEAALYLASDEAKYVSGVNLLVDGGYSCNNRPADVATDQEDKGA